MRRTISITIETDNGKRTFEFGESQASERFSKRKIHQYRPRLGGDHKRPDYISEMRTAMIHSGECSICYLYHAQEICTLTHKTYKHKLKQLFAQKSIVLTSTNYKFIVRSYFFKYISNGCQLVRLAKSIRHINEFAISLQAKYKIAK